MFLLNMLLDLTNELDVFWICKILYWCSLFLFFLFSVFSTFWFFFFFAIFLQKTIWHFGVAWLISLYFWHRDLKPVAFFVMINMHLTTFLIFSEQIYWRTDLLLFLIFNLIWGNFVCTKSKTVLDNYFGQHSCLCQCSWG